MILKEWHVVLDKRLNEVSHLRAPVNEMVRLETLYRARYDSWNVKHFYSKYKGEHEGQRSYPWVKLVKKGKHKGAHRQRRERAPLAGMMIHQDGSTHAWVEAKVGDLHHDGRCHQRDLFWLFRRRRRHREQLSRCV